MDSSETGLEETRAALAPTLEAAKAILPWVATPEKPRFPPALAKRWQASCKRLAAAWAGSQTVGLAPVRPAVFELCAVALELGDSNALRLSEALASATDRLENTGSDRRLATTLTAMFECLGEENCLEHAAFPERARHLAARLERCADADSVSSSRSPVLDRIFVGETGECLERIRDALIKLPPDAHEIKRAAGEIARHAEMLELADIAALAGRLNRLIAIRTGEHTDLEAQETRSAATALAAQLDQAIAAL